MVTKEPVITLKDGDRVIEIRKVYTKNGERLRIEAVHMNRFVELDPLETESLTWQTEESLQKALASH